LYKRKHVAVQVGKPVQEKMDAVNQQVVKIMDSRNLGVGRYVKLHGKMKHIPPGEDPHDWLHLSRTDWQRIGGEMICNCEAGGGSDDEDGWGTHDLEDRYLEDLNDMGRQGEPRDEEEEDGARRKD
jgi:hypothetical protein